MILKGSLNTCSEIPLSSGWASAFGSSARAAWSPETYSGPTQKLLASF